MTNRRQRGKRESFFLELVKDELNSISCEIADLKLLVVQSLLPPVAPPVIENVIECDTDVSCKASQQTRDSFIPCDTFLSLRPCPDIHISVSADLPKMAHLHDAQKNLQMFGCNQINWSSMTFPVDNLHDEPKFEAEEHDEITDFVDARCDTAYEGDPLDITSTTKSVDDKSDCRDDVATRIRSAQRAAWRRVQTYGNKLSTGTLNLFGSKRSHNSKLEDSLQNDSLETHFAKLRESMSVQGFEKEFHYALSLEDVAPLHQGFTSAKAFGPHPGRQETNALGCVITEPHVDGVSYCSRSSATCSVITSQQIYDWMCVHVEKLKTLPSELKGPYLGEQVARLEEEYVLSKEHYGMLEKVSEAYAPWQGDNDQFPFMCSGCGARNRECLTSCSICQGTDTFNERAQRRRIEKYGYAGFHCDFGSDGDLSDSSCSEV